MKIENVPIATAVLNFGTTTARLPVFRKTGTLPGEVRTVEGSLPKAIRRASDMARSLGGGDATIAVVELQPRTYELTQAVTRTPSGAVDAVASHAHLNHVEPGSSSVKAIVTGTSFAAFPYNSDGFPGIDGTFKPVSSLTYQHALRG